jgi:hypothetical protein
VSGSTSKKVLVDRFDRETLRGWVNPQSWLQSGGLELVTPQGNASVLPFDQVKAVSFVRDLDGVGILGERREFLARPKSVGLWVGLRFRDGDRLQGVVPNNLLLLETQGYSIVPPEAGGNTQRVFVPKQALLEVSVLGVIGSAVSRARPRKPAPDQITLFSEDLSA